MTLPSEYPDLETLMQVMTLKERRDLEELLASIPIEERYANDPVGYVREVLGGHPWSKQREILEALRDHDRVTVRSSHGTGKTWLAANAALWFLNTRKNSIVLSTAPTWRQVSELLWREVRAVHGRCHLPGQCNETDLELGPQWYAMGLSTNDPDRFQGFHAEHLLLICDEAAGIPPSIYEAAEGVLTTVGSKRLLIGNPTSTVGTFYNSHHGPGSKAWYRVHIAARHSPNFTGEAIAEEVRKKLVTQQWALERAEEWGENSGRYRARVEGEFSREEGLVYPEWDPVVHLVPDWMPRQSNPQWCAIDIGWNNPTAILLAEIDFDGTLGIWEERYVTHSEPAEHLRWLARAMRLYGIDPTAVQFLMDPSAWNHTQDGRQPPAFEWMRQADELGFSWFAPAKANNDVDTGILRVKRYMRPFDVQGHPRQSRLRVARHLRWLPWELDHYSWPKVRGNVAQEEKPIPEKPVKKDDHLADTLRYLAMQLPEPSPVKRERPTDLELFWQRFEQNGQERASTEVW